MSVFTLARRLELIEAVRVYRDSLPRGCIIEAATKDGINYASLKTWARGTGRDNTPVSPSPQFLLLLFLATGSRVFILLPEEVEKCEALSHPQYRVPEEMKLLSARRIHIAEQLSKEGARIMVAQIRNPLASNTQLAMETRLQPSGEKPYTNYVTPTMRGKPASPATRPAYTLERLGEIADAIQAYYRHVLATVLSKDRDEFMAKLQKMNWLRVRPEKRVNNTKKNAGPGPNIMWELFQRTRNRVFILQPREVEIFQARKISVSEEMLTVSLDFQAPAVPAVVAIGTAVPAHKAPEKPVMIFSTERVQELAAIIGTWVNGLGTTADPVDDRFETRAAKILGLSPGEVFLLKTGRQLPSPENLARIYAVFPHEKLRLSDQEIALAKAAGLGVSEAELLQKEISARAAVGDSTLLVQVDAKVQAVLRVLEVLVARLPETHDLIGAGKLPEQKGLAILVSRQMNVIRATLLTLDALMSSADAIVLEWKNSAIDLMSQMLKAFKLNAADFQAREPKAVDDPDIMRMLDSLFGRGGTK